MPSNSFLLFGFNLATCIALLQKCGTLCIIGKETQTVALGERIIDYAFENDDVLLLLSNKIVYVNAAIGTEARNRKVWHNNNSILFALLIFLLCFALLCCYYRFDSFLFPFIYFLQSLFCYHQSESF